jgi:hypothetical protein
MKQTTLSPTNLTTIFGNCSGRALTAMGIMDQVRDRLLWQESYAAILIRESKEPDAVIVRMLRDMCEDNAPAMTLMLDSNLVNEILKF